MNEDTLSNPTLKLIIESIIDNKFKLGLAGTNAPQAFKLPKELKIYKRGNYDVLVPKRPVKFLKFAWSFLKLTYHLYRDGTKCIMAVDPLGLIMAGRFKVLKWNLKIHYFSFEIFFNHEMNSKSWKRIKAKEIFYTRIVSTIIVQDEQRQKILIKENNIGQRHSKNWYLIPVALIASNENVSKSNNIRNQYGLNQNCKLLLHTGTVAPWSGAQTYIELLEKGIPDNHVLFIHSRYKLVDSDDSHLKLKRLQEGGYPVILHDHFFTNDDEYFEFLKNFDYGLALYEKQDSVFTGDNIKHIGLASGKFSCYMAAGLISIVSDLEVYRVLNNRFKFGKLAGNADEILELLQSGELQELQPQSARRLYDECLDPQTRVNKYLKSLFSLEG